ncbi:TolC family protein [Gillisia sp. M10.2A]|uniref:TolC family protein n=1 Tax=Gillisia lutea TaxID=2909668 RepID=A0ABS9EI66_9FLAO|nr:TolC family protein [Gillisia lutea]MCF4101148.1 TolC family protein [Gillisia lutea]
MKKILILTYTLLFCSFMQAQQIELISKEEVLTQVKENNLHLKILEQEVIMAKADYNQTNAIFLPNLKASHTAITTTNPLMAFGSKLNQEIITQTDFDPNGLNNPSRIENYATKFEIQQPLLNLDGIFKRQAARSIVTATQFKLNRAEDYIELEIEKAYMQLQLAYKTLDVLEITRRTVQENLRFSQDRFDQGYLQKPDLLMVEVRLIEVENQLQYAKSEIENASNYMSVLMAAPVTVTLKPTDSLVPLPINLALDLKLSENRADLQAMQIATKAFQQNYRADKMTFLPRLNAFGSYELYDDNIFQGAANGYVLGAELSWTILEGSKRFGKLQKSKADLEKSKFEYEKYKSESELEINKAKRMYLDAENNLRLTKLALEQAEESLRIRSNRFKEGLERTSDLLLSETQYAQKQLDYYNAIYQQNYTNLYVVFLTKN